MEPRQSQLRDLRRLAWFGIRWPPLSLSASGVGKAQALLGVASSSRDEDGSMAVTDMLLAAAEIAAKTVNDALGDLEGRWEEAAKLRVGAVRPAGRGDQGVTHKVLVGNGALPSSLWVSACGWLFGARRHVRVPVREITCEHCIKWANPVDT